MTTTPPPTSSAAAPEPGFVRWALKFAATAGLTGMICCVAPMVLFMFGVMGAAYAMSFATFFYAADGSAGTGAYILRGLAVVIGIAGILIYRRKQNQCSIDPARKRRNLLLVCLLIPILGIGVFFSLESLSGWYFKKHIVPVYQSERSAGVAHREAVGSR